MTRTIITLILLAAMAFPAWGFRFYGTNGWMEDTETPEEKQQRAARQAEQRQQREAAEAQWREEQARIQEHNARMNAMYRAQNPPQQVQVCPAEPQPTKARPGGKRRRIWREQTGFNTPAHRTRYVQEINRLNRELAKERAKSQ